MTDDELDRGARRRGDDQGGITSEWRPKRRTWSRRKHDRRREAARSSPRLAREPRHRRAQVRRVRRHRVERRCCRRRSTRSPTPATRGCCCSGGKRAHRPADERHPFGYAPVRYFYSFIVAFVLFSLGGVFSIFEGIEKLRQPARGRGPRDARSRVLLGAMVLEALSFRTARAEANEVRPKASRGGQFIRHTKSPDLPVVLLEDFAALIGLVIALVGVTLADVTDNVAVGRCRQPRDRDPARRGRDRARRSRWAACSSAKAARPERGGRDPRRDRRQSRA